MFKAVRNPETGECTSETIPKKEDAEIYGQWGAKVGDLVYFMQLGYTDTDIEYTCIKKENLSVPAVGENGGSLYSPSIFPTAKLDFFVNSAFFTLNGDEVRNGYQRPHSSLSVGVVLTLAFLLGIPIPKDADGKPFLDAIRRG